MAERVLVTIAGRQVSVKSGDIFGRGRYADVEVEGSVVSRKHAQVHRGPDGWFVTDLGSSNGLFDATGARTEFLALPAGTTRFTLGPPDVGPGIEVTIPPDMAAPPTVRVNRSAEGRSWPPAPPHATIAPPRRPEAEAVPFAGPRAPGTPPPDAGASASGATLPTSPPDAGAAASGATLSTSPPDAGATASGATLSTSPPDAGATASGAVEAGAAAAQASATPAAPPPAPAAAAPLTANPNGGVAVRAEAVTVVVNGGDLTILQPTSLSLPAGSMTAIVGPSGCGKSTLANLLSGRGEPTGGAVHIDGRPMTPAVRTGIGVVPQYDAVHERLTVRRALRAAARLRLPPDTPREDVDEAVESTAAVLDLDDRLDTRVAKLSGGQKKRVSVGYELVSEPTMMVLDEPTSGLDPGLEAELIAELRALADRGTTTVVVTHSPEAAMEADLVIVLAPGGHLTFVGPPDDVLPNFGVDDWSDVFSRLTGETAIQWARHFVDTPQYRQWVMQPPVVSAPPSVSAFAGVAGSGVAGAAVAAGGVAAEVPKRSRGRDLAVMTGRYTRSLVADWRSLLLLSVQAPILGLLFAAVLSKQVFATPLVPRTNAREFVLAAVLAMVWIGASNSVREIVKERRTFLRERAVGVSATSLVASRWLVLSVITVLQAVVLYYTATSRQQVPLTDGVLLSDGLGGGPVEMMLAFALVGLASVGLGLLLSSVVSDVTRAMAVLPVLLIPVVLFSGLLIPVTGEVGVEQLSWVNPVQWGSSAAAVVADVLANEGCDPDGLQAALQQALLGRTVSCTNPRWQPTTTTQAVNLGVAVLQVIVLAALSFVAADRSTRNLRG
ncbi:MAG: ATP-binding cassette domain-containing protein [Actinomycetota bacterium]